MNNFYKEIFTEYKTIYGLSLINNKFEFGDNMQQSGKGIRIYSNCYEKYYFQSIDSEFKSLISFTDWVNQTIEILTIAQKEISSLMGRNSRLYLNLNVWYTDQFVKIKRVENGNKTDRRVYSTIRLRLRIQRKKSEYSLDEVFNLPYSRKEFSQQLLDYLRYALEGCCQMVGAKYYPDISTENVLFSREAAAFFIHEACSHHFEADALLGGASVFSNIHEGEYVANSIFSLADISNYPGCALSLKVDDEGTECIPIPLISQGILSGGLYDFRRAKLLGKKAGGNGRRHDYRYPSLPRIRISMVSPGTSKLDDVISDIKKGVFISRIRSGKVNIVTGKFSLAVSEVYLIRNGKIAYPIAPFTITGFTTSALKNIEAVCDDLYVTSHPCGKGDQVVPVGIVCPSLFVKNLKMG
ncbi:hypothetical protein BBF96_10275 [Anoxybacter fermentans]|uniref:Metalloprotease TldD/E C-terminal domain-containing protein n=1 Tax=Anoxybacter fermentans TaxID=1323375 RepID=A0A3S9SZH3_9FIRM|nr:metallopeptidase TldD-related protein [Anoxybacter fermentans]AZR73736.1 hypothetical protein BBF96_10275 [Anoxybacter fermentans]